MIYSEHPLPPAAQAHGICLWRFEVELSDAAEFTHVIPPDGTVSLALSLYPGDAPRFTLTGPSATAFLVPAVHGMSAAGVRLRPGTAPLLTGLTAHELVDRLQPWDTDTRGHDRLGTALIAYARDESRAETAGHAFAALCASLPPVDPLVAELSERLRRNPFETRVEAASGDLGLGPRQVRRRFAAATGLAPKTFARMQRLRHACVLALDTPAANWAEVASAAGFADQAHFNRDVARTFGITPTRLISYLGTIRHDLVRA